MNKKTKNPWKYLSIGLLIVLAMGIIVPQVDAKEVKETVLIQTVLDLLNDGTSGLDALATDLGGLATDHDDIDTDVSAHDGNIDGDLVAHNGNMISSLVVHDGNIGTNLDAHGGALVAHNSNIDDDLVAHDLNIDGDLVAHNGNMISSLVVHDGNIGTNLDAHGGALVAHNAAALDVTITTVLGPGVLVSAGTGVVTITCDIVTNGNGDIIEIDTGRTALTFGTPESVNTITLALSGDTLTWVVDGAQDSGSCVAALLS